MTHIETTTENTHVTSLKKIPMTTWLLIFCVFNLIVTVCLFGASMRRMHTFGAAGMMNRNQTMKQGNGMMTRGGRTNGGERQGMMQPAGQSADQTPISGATNQ